MMYLLHSHSNTSAGDKRQRKKTDLELFSPGIPCTSQEGKK